MEKKNKEMLNQIFNEDCLEGMKRIEDKSIDMILCDLPYGTTQNKWDSVIPFDELWYHYNRIIKDNGAIVLFAQTPFDKTLGASNLKMLKYEWTWIKNRGTGHLNAKKMPMKAHENILVFYKKLPTYNPQMRDGEAYIRKDCNKQSLNKGNYGEQVESITTVNKGGRYPLDYLEFPIVERTIHPTQKPTELVEYLIKTYSNEGDVVLDNCIGSGTTAIACLNTNRNYIGFELEEEYFLKAMDRIFNIN